MRYQRSRPSHGLAIPRMIFPARGRDYLLSCIIAVRSDASLFVRTSLIASTCTVLCGRWLWIIATNLFETLRPAAVLLWPFTVAAGTSRRHWREPQNIWGICQIKASIFDVILARDRRRLLLQPSTETIDRNHRFISPTRSRLYRHCGKFPPVCCRCSVVHQCLRIAPSSQALAIERVTLNLW